MPLHSETDFDPITPMVRFKPSVVFETLISLMNVAASWRNRLLSEEVQAELGKVFIRELQEFYDEYHMGCDLNEIPVDFEDHHDIEGFFRYIESMEPRKFAFYVLGRHFHESEIPEDLSEKSIRSLIESSPKAEEMLSCFPNVAWAEDVEGFKKKILSLWRNYWEHYFKDKVEECRELWNQSVAEKQELLGSSGGTALYTDITGWDELPDPIPPEIPFSIVEFIPIYFAAQRVQMYYGYGRATVLYDCTRTKERVQAIHEDKQAALSAFKALSDENRLKILKLISKYEKLYNGQTIAKKLSLSPSVVSRHLAQLKDSGLIREFSPDNRNITYSLDIDALRSLPGKVEAYLKD